MVYDYQSYEPFPLPDGLKDDNGFVAPHVPFTRLDIRDIEVSVYDVPVRQATTILLRNPFKDYRAFLVPRLDLPLDKDTRKSQFKAWLSAHPDIGFAIPNSNVVEPASIEFEPGETWDCDLLVVQLNGPDRSARLERLILTLLRHFMPERFAGVETLDRVPRVATPPS